MMQDKPFSQACENNKAPIVAVLKAEFKDSTKVLEIGSGTGQHAVYFASKLPQLIWQTSDRPEYHADIQAWLNACPSPNLISPIPLTIGKDEWPSMDYDGVFTANTTHIMQAHEAQKMMQMVAEYLPSGGVFCQYGPFKFDQAYTSDSNRDFDESLLAQGFGGIRDLAELKAWAQPLTLIRAVPMPANNYLLVWHKS
ncbi:DUF938 domain-containing protein [Paraglaciecola aestuariivivens]